jgi:hypothetical protein
MRRLLSIPILHEEADLGSAGGLLAQQASRALGQERWALHQEVLGRFWEGVERYLASQDPRRLKLYQDGLPADGPVGQRIVEEAARRGSRNYQLILTLLRRGAELRKTEDLVLLLQERQDLLGLLEEKAAPKASGAPQGHPRRRERLLAQRDEFIAQTINGSLKEGEVGVLLLGAQHNVLPLLAGDIAVEEVPSRAKVQAYFQELLTGRDEARLRGLAQDLTPSMHLP